MDSPEHKYLLKKVFPPSINFRRIGESRSVIAKIGNKITNKINNNVSMTHDMKSKNKEYVPSEAMPPAQSATSPEALSRLRAEKKEQIKYYYFDPIADNLLEIPPTVDRIDLSPRRKGEYLIKIKNGMVIEIRTFKDDEILEPERKQAIKEKIKKELRKRAD